MKPVQLVLVLALLLGTCTGLVVNAPGSYCRPCSRLHAKKKKTTRLTKALGVTKPSKDALKEEAKRWTLVSGVSVPQSNGELKGWSLPTAEGSPDLEITAVQYDDKLFALSPSACSKCAWDLYKGKLVDLGGDNPAIACPLCGATYRLSDGRVGEPVEVSKEGFGGMVGGLARTVTAANKAQNARCYPVRVDPESGGVLIALAGAEAPTSRARRRSS